MENSKYFNLLVKLGDAYSYQNESIKYFKLCIKQYAKSIDLIVELDSDIIILKSGVDPLLFDKLILFILELPELSDYMKSYLSGVVSIENFFSKLKRPVYFLDIVDCFDELMSRGLHFDFNDCNNTDKTLVAIDADDRVKFIPYKKYKFEEDLNNLLADLILQKEVKDLEIVDFINTKIKNYLIGKQTFEILDNDLTTYSHMIDYLYSDSFNNEIGLKGLHGCSLESIQENVRIWTAAFSKQKVKDNLAGRVLVFNAFGYDWFRLKNADALDYESAIMGHCVGQGSYDKKVEGNEIEIYSLRDEANQPHVTIEMNKGFIKQIKGKSNRQILEKYRKSTIDFIVKYLNIEVRDIPDGIRHYVLLSSGANPIPLVFKDLEYLLHYMASQSSIGASMESIIYELVKDESVLFKYNIEDVYQQMLKLVAGKIGTIDGIDGFVDLSTYKLMRMHVVPAIPKDMDIQLFAKLYKISTLSELRQWSIDVLRPILKKAKYKSQAQELLKLSESISIVLGITLVDLIDSLFNEEMEIYKQAKRNMIIVSVDLESTMKTIKELKTLSEQANYPTSKDFRRTDFSIPEIGCDECLNDKLVGELKKYQSDMESSISAIEESAEQISSFIDFGVDIASQMEDFIESLASSISSQDILIGIDSVGYNYKLDDQFKYLNERAKSIVNSFEEDAWSSWSRRGIKFKDYDDIVASYEKSVKSLKREKDDFEGISVEECEHCNPMTIHHRDNRPECSVADALLDVDDSIMRFFNEMDDIKKYTNPKLLNIAEQVSHYVRSVICASLFVD